MIPSELAGHEQGRAQVSGGLWFKAGVVSTKML